ncbi:class I SAM-dependent methyltransferase [Nonomuraea angiospora]|uniref:SAM-dependent methyltransferase n=1 Tax=Nonomuraea angiospora TaxID=46172 RepID=A0ABR9LS87_9ACTN|nr:class I SAM-dependent methyltransferase [Nonomuraea angiospora]MBE1583535.1 SAM-dependent methyltransferase [Nonomuraea angiospora]
MSSSQSLADPGSEPDTTSGGAVPPQPGTFDLVHARLVLVHVPDRARALATMVAALRPGGRLSVEDADTGLQPLACRCTRCPPPHRVRPGRGPRHDDDPEPPPHREGDHRPPVRSAPWFT